MKITIDFEKENLTQLIKAVFFAAWMKNATKAEDELDLTMDTFAQYVLGTLYAAGEKTRIQVSPEGRYGVSDELEELLFEQIDEYDSEVFWEELVDQLARRDWFQKNPSKIGKELTGAAAEEADAGIEREKDKYDKEFEQNGVERLRIAR